MSTDRLFITGGSGFIGSVIIEKAKQQKKQIYALSRSDASDTRLRHLGANPIRGDVTSLDILEQQAALSNGVIHLATAHLPTNITFEEAVSVDIAALDALAKGLAGSGKPLVSCSGTLSAQPDPSGLETDETGPLQDSPLAPRYKVEAHGLSFSKQDIRASSIRIAANTYGRGGGVIRQYMSSAMQAGGVNSVDGGRNRLTACHVGDCADLFIRVAEKGRAGEVYNASASTTTTARELSEAIAEILDLPIRDLTSDEARKVLGDVGVFFVTHDNRASGGKARKELGWNPTGVELIDDVRTGSYVAVAAALKDGSEDTKNSYFGKAK